VNIGFLQPDGETTKTVTARVGESFLQTAHRYEIDLEGACEGMYERVVVGNQLFVFLLTHSLTHIRLFRFVLFGCRRLRL
jgi:hypothetical protein